MALNVKDKHDYDPTLCRGLTDTERVIAWFRKRAVARAADAARNARLAAAGSCRCGAERMKDRTRCLECARKNARAAGARYHAKKLARSRG